MLFFSELKVAFRTCLCPHVDFPSPGSEVGLSWCCWRGWEGNCSVREEIYGNVGLFRWFTQSFSLTKQLVAGTQRWMALGAALEALQSRGVDLDPRVQQVMPAFKSVFIVEWRVWLFAAPWTVARQNPRVQGILQARTLEWVAIPFSRGSSTQGLKLGLLHGRQFLYHLSHQGSPVEWEACISFSVFSLPILPYSFFSFLISSLSFSHLLSTLLP